jgi:hypothetical protein
VGLGWGGLKGGWHWSACGTRYAAVTCSRREKEVISGAAYWATGFLFPVLRAVVLGSYRLSGDAVVLPFARLGHSCRNAAIARSTSEVRLLSASGRRLALVLGRPAGPAAEECVHGHPRYPSPRPCRLCLDIIAVLLLFFFSFGALSSASPSVSRIVRSAAPLPVFWDSWWHPATVVACRICGSH